MESARRGRHNNRINVGDILAIDATIRITARLEYVVATNRDPEPIDCNGAT